MILLLSHVYAAWCLMQLRRCIKIPRCNALVAFKAFFSIECWCNTATREYILALLNSHSACPTAASWKFKLRVYFSHLLTRLVRSWYFKDDRKLFNLEMWTQLSDRESARISLLSLETHYKITIGNVRIQTALGLQKENKEWQIVALSI